MHNKVKINEQNIRNTKKGVKFKTK